MKNIQIVFSKKWKRQDSIQWWYFAYLCCCFTSETFNAFFTTETESWLPLNPIRLENQFQKSWNQFRKPILILFSITISISKVPGIQGFQRENQKGCACVYICVIPIFIFNYVFLNVNIWYIEVVYTYYDSRSILSHILRPHGLQPPVSSGPQNSPDKITRVGCHDSSRNRPNSGSNPSLPHCRQSLYLLSH